jgi:tetratricopeptide (TPR) repeat protein
VNTTFLHEPGDLARAPFAAVLIEALNLRATGALQVDHDGGTSQIFIRDGIPVGSQSFAGFMPLGQILLARGRIDVAALNESLGTMAATGRPQGEVLVEMGAVSQAEVDVALTEQQEQYLARIAALESGTFRFDADRPPPEWTRGIRIQPLRAIVRALEKPQAAALVVSALQPAAVDPISLASGYQRLASAFGFSPAESRLVARLASRTTLEAFFAEPGVAPERARAILAALLLLGLAQASPVGETLETVPGIVVDLADLAGVEAEPEPPVRPPPPRPTPSGADPRSAAPAAPRRSDPAEARLRRQRLLQRAMQNMGIGPLAGRGEPGAPRAARAPGAFPTPPPGATPPPAPPRDSPEEQELRRTFEATAPRARSPDLFARLGLDRTAGRDQVKQAYFRLAKQLHPDRFLSPALADIAAGVKDLFAAFNEAYETLSDDRRRGDYLARSAKGGRTGPVQVEAASHEFQKGEACLRTRDFPRARSFYEAAIRAHPLPEYQAALAWALCFDPKAPDRSRGKQLLAAALRDPTCDRAAYTAAMVARDEGDEDAAERMFRIALKANPRHVEAEREVRLIEARRRRK